MSRYVMAQNAHDFIHTLQDGSVDLFLTDPPYMGIVADSWDNQWKTVDEYVEWMYNLLEILKPKMKPTGSVIFFGGIGKHGEKPFFSLLQRIESANLYHYRNLITWGKRRAYGKMISLDTDLPTPTGFVTLRHLKEGDQLLDETGQICQVTKLHPIVEKPASFKITFDDGSEVTACAEHLWATATEEERKSSNSPTIKTTKEIMETLLSAEKKYNHSISCCKPIAYQHQMLPVEPYLLGSWLRARLESRNHSHSIQAQLTEDIERQLIQAQLIDKGQLCIPELYLFSATPQRQALLAGLTAGTQPLPLVNSESLAAQIAQLISSLGFKSNPSDLTSDLTSDNNHRYIVNVKQIKPEPMRCITVDSPSGLFLVTKSFIPTHNSHDYLFCREEIAWYSVSPERTGVTFNVPFTAIKRGYSGFSKQYPAKSDYKRVSNIWTDIPELMKPERQAQKPIPLLNRLIETHSNAGDLIVDCFVGWGTTGVAALGLGRRFLGAERIEADADKANERCIACTSPAPASPPPSIKSSEIQSSTSFTPQRQLVHRFLSLPFRLQLTVANNLNLLTDEERMLSSNKLLPILFKRAHDQSLLDKLWDEIEKYSPDPVSNNNPFKRFP